MKNHLKELKELLIFGFMLQSVLTDFVKSEKPRMKWLASFKFMPLIPTIAPAFEGLGNPLDHYKALTVEEKADLYEYFQNEFDIPNDALEAVIEDTIGVAAANIELGKRWVEVTRRNK